ncbi:MAG: mechanosensitive ion channel [Turneriella sp.]|nr:mechanosensitive ion channel [Turneriella sp.]
MLERDLIVLGKYHLTLLGLLQFLAFVGVIWLLLRIIHAGIFRSKYLDRSRQFAAYSFARYLIVTIALFSGLQILGVDVSVLMAGSAALLVGLGLGLQNLFSDFVSGIILLVDRTIKVGDVLEIGKLVCRVQAINLRTTTVQTRDDTYIVLPNAHLTKEPVINWTHSDVAARFEISVGVSFSSDVRLVRKLLVQAADAHPKVMCSPKTYTRFEDFGDSALLFRLFFFTEEVFRAGDIQSDIRESIWTLFAKHGVKIPFPQRVLHQATEPKPKNLYKKRKTFM